MKCWRCGDRLTDFDGIFCQECLALARREAGLSEGDCPHMSVSASDYCYCAQCQARRDEKAIKAQGEAR